MGFKAPLVWVAGVWLALAGCGGEPAEHAVPPQHAASPPLEGGTVVAQVGDTAITEGEFNRRLLMLSDAHRAQIGDDPARLAQFLHFLVDEALMERAAVDLELDRQQEFRRTLHDARRQLLAQYYLDFWVSPRAAVDSAFVQRYYEEHPEEFTVDERVTGRQIVLSTDSAARDVRAQLVAGVPFDSLLALSTDTHTRALGGSLGIVSRGRPVRGIGDNDAFVEALMALEPGDISEPIQTDQGYHVVRLESHDAERLRTLGAVYASLKRRLEPLRQRQARQATLDSLRAAVDVSLDATAFGAPAGEEARLLFEQAQETGAAAERVEIYEQIAERFPDSQFAVQAQFMRGFVFIEELADTTRGRAVLERLIADYPNADLVDSAKWMLDNTRSGGS